MTLSHNGKMISASNQMAHNFTGAIARVWRISSELGIKNRKHAMLTIFHVEACLCTLQAYVDVKFGIQILCSSNLLLILKPTTTFAF